MKKYLYDYIKKTDTLLYDKDKISKSIIDEHLIKISFFQHERLIHLLVTFFFAILFLIFIGLSFKYYRFFPIAIILLIFVICYVLHYFYLENGVQYLYKQYDKMNEKK